MNNRNMARLGEKLVRRAYDMEDEARRLRAVDDSIANSIEDMAGRCGRIGRDLLDRAGA
jgi:hypothetical protein